MPLSLPLSFHYNRRRKVHAKKAFRMAQRRRNSGGKVLLLNSKLLSVAAQRISITLSWIDNNRIKNSRKLTFFVLAVFLSTNSVRTMLCILAPLSISPSSCVLPSDRNRLDIFVAFDTRHLGRVAARTRFCSIWR